MNRPAENRSGPRGWAVWLLHLVVRGPGAEFVLGDVEEEYADRVNAHGRQAADRWFRRHAFATGRDWLRGRALAPGSGAAKEIAYAGRVLVRAPGFTSATVLTLGLGLGGAAAVLALADAILRPLDFPDPDRLVAVWETKDGAQNPVAPANYLDWRREATASFAGLAAHITQSASITVDGLATRARVSTVSGNFFDVLGAGATRGRTFDPALDSDFPDRLAVLSYESWQTVFHGDSDVLGRTLLVEDQSYEIVGIATPDLSVPEEGVAAWLRSRTEAPELRFFGGDLREMRDAWYFEVIGRLLPDASMQAAREELATIAVRLERLHPEINEGRGTQIVSLREQTVAGFTSSLLALAISVVLLLLAASINVTHLALGRWADRSGDISVRVALGASRASLVRHAGIEGAMLGLAGAGVGLPLASLAISAGVAGFGAALPRSSEVGLSWGPTLAVVLGGCAIGIAVSLAAFARSQPWASTATRLRGRGWGTRWTADGLVVAQVAAAVTLLATAGLLGRSVYRLARVDLGFDAENFATVRVALPDAHTRGAGDRLALFEDLRAQIEALPEVRVASYAAYAPLSMGLQAGLRVTGWNRPTDPGNVGWHPVHERYFEALGIPLLSGRNFTSADRTGAIDVALVNEALVRSVFPGEDPIGRRVSIGLDGHDRPITIVGVVQDTRTRGPASDPGPVLFRPIHQTDGFAGESVLMIAAVEDAKSNHLAAMSDVIRAARPELPVYSATLGIDLADSYRKTQSSLLAVLAVFAATALLLGGVGVYGVAAHATRRRRREIGVRMALGADAHRVLASVLREGLLKASVGIPLGIALSLLVGRSLQALLFDIQPADPATLAAVSATVLLVTSIALVIPARSAATTDPAAATRAE